MIFQAYLLSDSDELLPLGEAFEARTSLDAVQQAREYWPGLPATVSEVKLTAEITVQE